MTQESSNDSSRHESGYSPRRAARAAREKAERERALEQLGAGDPAAAGPADDGPARHGSARHGGTEQQAEPEAESSATSKALEAAEAIEAAKNAKEAVAAAEAQAASAVKAAGEERARTAAGERTKALDAAQRARTQGALRARQEAIEAQRAAAERVRQTLRANAAPLRDRSVSARSAFNPELPDAPRPSSRRRGTPAGVPPDASAAQPAASAPSTPFDQDAAQYRPADPASAAADRENATHQDVAGSPDGQQLVDDQAPSTAIPTKQPSDEPLPGTGPDTVPEDGETHAWDPAPEAALSDAIEPATEPATDTQVHPEAGHGARPSERLHGQDAEQHPARHPGHQDPAFLEPEPREPEPLDHGTLEPEPREPEPLAPESLDAYAGYVQELQGAGAYPLEPDEALERENLFLNVQATDHNVRRSRRRRRNWIVTAVLLGFCAVIFGIVIFLQGMLSKLSPEDYPAPGGESIAFEVKPGWGPKQIGRALESSDIVASDKLFIESIQLVEADNREIHPGTYDLRLQMPALEAASILIGEPADKVSYVAIKQNTRMTQVLEEIAKSTGIPAAELDSLADDPQAFGIDSGATNLEGYLHPGEYRFPVDAEAKTVLQAMVDATTKTLSDEGITDPQRQYHVLKVASILQAEARQDDYGTVAGALENRLHPDNTETNGLLQVDSAVIYGLDRFSLQFSGEEKTDASNPYNTYVHKGLPPTPIGSPGDPAIKAAAHPTPNDYFYWVTVNTNSGETKFAKTYAEHQVYQNEFRTWCAANTDVCN